MQVNHLTHTGVGIVCSCCGKCFPLPGRVLFDPYRVLEAKEHIASTHTCRAQAQTHPPRARVISFDSAKHATRREQLTAHWNRVISREFSTPGAA